MAFTQNQIGLEGSFGYIWVNTNNWTGTTFSFTNAYQEMSGMSTAYTLISPSQDFAMTTDGRLKYTGISTKLFTVDAGFYPGTSFNYALQLRVNGSAVTGSDVYASAGRRPFIARFPVSLATNDYLSMFTKSNVSHAGVVIYMASLSATYMGGS